MNERHPHAAHTFATTSIATFEEIRDGNHWLMAMHKTVEGRRSTKLVCFSEWHAQTTLDMLGRWAREKVISWDECAIFSERIRYHSFNVEALNTSLDAARRDVGALQFLLQCWFQVSKELMCELQRLELLRGCLSDVECGR
jgi:hypothetical protein